MTLPLRRAFFLSALVLISIFAVADRATAQTCGGNNQRYCCLWEGSACDAGHSGIDFTGPGNGQACTTGPFGITGSSLGTCYRDGVHPPFCGSENQAACAATVQIALGIGPCKSSLVNAGGTCRSITSCGAAGERACCLLEESFGACEGDLTEVPGCTGNCLCSSGVASSSGTCIETSNCGGPDERACCVGEGNACDVDLTQVPGCAGNCFCSGGVLGSESSGTCIETTPCGGTGERACCVGETINGGNGGGCDSALIEVPGCEGADCQCGGGVFGSSSSGTCQVATVATGCGGEGQRACCFTTFEGANCNPDLVEVAGCSGNCLCGGFNPLDLTASGTCHRPTPCGGEGERTCCAAERTPSCDAGLTEISGCSGDCFCGDSLTGVVDDDLLGLSAGTCVRSPVPIMMEPAVGHTELSSHGCSVRGYADLHMHLFADIAHGGGVLAAQPCPRGAETYCPETFLAAGPMAPGSCGTSYCDDSLNVNTALNACYGTDQDLVAKTGSALATPLCPSWIPDCGDKLFHGDHTVFDDAVGSNVGTFDGSGYAHLGAPAFHGWPQWTTTTHQQAYYKWLERAWRGGLRLIVQMAVNNTALCITNKQLDGVDCNDTMAFIDQQLQAAYDFEDFIDRRVGSGVDDDEGWFRIVKTPREAREAIANGRMAVVLGVEVDNLFNCAFPKEQCMIIDDQIVSCDFEEETPECKDPNDPSKSSADYVRDQVDYYYDTWGVRHMFPIHNFDNAYGGAATWQSAIEVGNRFVEGHWYNTRDCSAEGYSFSLGEEGTLVQSLAAALGFGILTTVPYHPEAASCNSFGLFPLGDVLMERMMERGMIIDIDHMSSLSFDAAVDLATNFRPGGYPLSASHVLFRDLHTPETRHERMRTPAQMNAIQALGGTTGVMLKDDVLDRGTRGERKTIDYPGSGVVDDCRHSSKTFAQALRYADDSTGGLLAMGSDFNGVAGHFGPRFGSDACGGDPIERSAQLREDQKLDYPFTLDVFGQFQKQQSGLKRFDYNVDGLAHVGLLPDFVADLKIVGLTDPQLAPLMQSAETYIQMWENALGLPVEQGCSCDPSQTAPGEYVCVPEPGFGAALASGLLVLFAMGRRRSARRGPTSSR